MSSSLRNSILLFVLFSSSFVQSQTIGENLSVQLSAVVNDNPVEIKLQWNPVADASAYRIYRKAPVDLNWGNPVAQFGANVNEYADSDVELSRAYEYKVEADRPGLNPGTAYGYLYSGVQLLAVDARGGVILVVDSTFSRTLAVEIEQLEMDMVGDGWQVFRLDVDRNDTPTSIRTKIQQLAAANDDIIAVYLLGHVPVAYSGEIAPDGHPDHVGAWPTDAYYGDLDGNWTDQVINNASASREANRNIPGDGKFDQSLFPSPIDLEVGRVDLANLPVFNVSEETLLKNYLDKSHRYKYGQIAVNRSGIIDDNFTTFAEGFSQNGWRNFGPLVGKDNIEAADYFSSLNSTPHLWSYGCGPGNYTSAGGVGSSTDFANNASKGIFTMLFGSYHGDWDSQNNFLRSSLASGNILTNAWAGRPNWFFHHMGLGENIGLSAFLSQNNPFFGNLYEEPGFGGGQIHSALMGDPTLRQDYPIAPAFVTVNAVTGRSAFIFWGPSFDRDVVGFLIYKSQDRLGPYERITPGIVPGFQYVDACLDDGLYYYMVRSVKLQRTPSGTYYNMSTGVFDTVLVQAKQQIMSVNIIPNHIRCHGLENGVATAVPVNGSAPFRFEWSTGDTTNVINNRPAGIYSVTVTDACNQTKTAEIEITQPDPIVSNISSTDETAGNLKDGTATVDPEGGFPPYEINWDYGSDEMTITDLEPGIYRVTITDNNNCQIVDSTFVQPFDCSLILSTTTTPARCFGGRGRVEAAPNGGTPPYEYLANGPGEYGAGTYIMILQDAGRCIFYDTFTITQPPVLTIEIVDKLNPDCQGHDNGSINLNITGGTGAYNITWSNGDTGSQIDSLLAGLYRATVTDANNCSNIIGTTLINEDKTPPTVLTKSATVFLGQNGTGTLNVNSVDNGSFDNCEINSRTLSHTTFNCSDLGNKVVNFTVTDQSGNVNSSTATVSIRDTLRPLLVCPSNITTIKCDSIIVFDTPVVTDNCAANPATVVSNIPSGNIFPVGVNTVIYEASDLSGNKGQCSFTVTVNSQLRINITGEPPSCHGEEDGSADLTISGAVGSVDILWNNNQTTRQLSDLPPGEYTVTVTNNGCKAIETIVLEEPAPISIIVDSVINVVSGQRLGSINVTTVGGTGPYRYEWRDPAGNVIASTEDIGNLQPGLYACTIMDANDCEYNFSLMVDMSESTTNHQLPDHIRVYPNPVYDLLTTEFDLDGYKQVRIRLIDATGRSTTETNKVSVLKDRLTVDLQQLSQGVYWLEILVGKEVYYSKVVKI